MFRNNLFRLFGLGVLSISSFYVFKKIWLNKEWILEWQPAVHEGFFLFVLAFIYALISILLSLSWFLLLKHYGSKQITFKSSFRIYARTQIAKYIPGNIFQFASRHVLGYRMGLDQGVLLAAAFSEVIGLIFAAGLVSLFGFSIWGDYYDAVFFERITIILTVSSAVLAIGYTFLPVIKQKLALNWKTFEIKILFFTFIPYLLFFLCSGGLVTILVHLLISPVESGHIGPIMTIFAFSWIAGFITPGAPGGIGVREAIIIASLSPFVSEPESILVSVLFRTVTILGDLIFALFSLLVSFNFSQARITKIKG